MIANAPDLERIVKREHGDPHSVLGAHKYNGGVVVRALRPAAQAVKVHAGSKDVELEQVHPAGIFEGVVPDADMPLEYELEVDYPDGNHFTMRAPRRAIAQVGRDRQLALAADLHRRETLIPSLDYLARAKPKAERLTTVA